VSKTGIVIPDCHTQPGFSNKRFDYLAQLLYDVRPDFVVTGGDWWDMANKKKLPLRIELEGNHEHRIVRAIHTDPVLLEGTIGLTDLQIERYSDVFVKYDGDTPGIYEHLKILFAHYFVTGVSGRPLSSENPASEFIKKKHRSCVGFHDHRVDLSYSAVGNATGKVSKKIMGLLAGCFLDYRPDFAGQSADLWWSGITVLHNVEDGIYDPEFVSLKRLKETYK
jgi:hypothetical protein